MYYMPLCVHRVGEPGVPPTDADSKRGFAGMVPVYTARELAERDYPGFQIMELAPIQGNHHEVASA